MRAEKQTEVQLIAKRFLIIFVPLVLILGIIFFLFFNTESNNYKELLKTEASNETNHVIAVMKTQFQLVLSDLMFLSDQNELQQALDAPETNNWEDLATEYLSFSARKQIYDQIRFIDETGMEIVRIDFNDGNPIIVPREQLQSKAKRYYFEDTFVLAQGEVFISPMDLNIEHGEIEQPLKQMLRFGTPIFDRDGHKRGVVILNYLAQNMTHHLELAPGGHDRIMLLNSDGYWLHSPNPEDEWGFMYPDKEDRTFVNNFPEAWLTITADESGQFFNSDGLFTFVTIYPLLEGQKSSTGSGSAFEPSAQQIEAVEYYWIVYVPSNVLSASIGPILNSVLLIFAFMVVIVAGGSWVGARAMVRRKQAEEDLQKANDQLEVRVKERTNELRITNEQLTEEISQRKQAQYDLGERVKELHCLYSIAMITERPAVTLDAIYEEVANVIPPGWQYPDITCARITIDGKEFNTPNYRETAWKQTSDILVDGQRIGAVDVFYLEEKPEYVEGPFLREERNLIDGIAHQLAGFIQRRRAEDLKEHLSVMLRAIRNVNQLIVKEKNLDRLLKRVCENFIDTRGFDIAWIALLDESGNIIKTAEAVSDKDLLPIVHQLKQGKLPNCGQRALGQSAVVTTKESSSSCTGCSLVKSCRDKGALTVRLEHNGKVYGLLSATLPAKFLAESQERSLFKEVAGDIAFALHSMEMEQERKQAEETLQESQASLVEAQRTAHIGNWELDRVSNTLTWSDEVYLMFGLEPQQFGATYEAFLDNIHPDDREMVNNAYAESVRNKTPYEIVHRLLLKDGTVKYVNEKCETFFDDDGKPIRSIGTIQDITEHVQAEENIKKAAEEWKITFDSITDLISIHDKDFKFIRVNKALADFFKMKPEELIGKYCYKVIHGKNEPVSNCPHMRTLEDRKPHVAEFFEPRLGHYLEMSTSPVFNDKGEIIGSVHITKDISERKKMEEQLIITDRLASVGELASGIAHELNNPLTGIIGFSELLLDKDVPDDVKEDLKVINREAKRTAKVVKGLLTFARKHPEEKQLVDINKVIQETLELRAYEQRVNNIKVNTQFAPDLPEVMSNSFELQQVFLNIIINAEHFMIETHGRGTFTITTEQLGDIIIASFADDGPGIAKDTLRHLFDPFFTTKEVGKGTGLGLSISHGIITSHGGRIYAESELGKGATFVVELPVHK